MTTDEGRELLSDIKRFGNPLMVFTGGDPLKRPDLYDLARHFFLVTTGRAIADDDLTSEEYEKVFEFLYEISKVAPFEVRTTEGLHYRRYIAQRLKVEHGEPSAKLGKCSYCEFTKICGGSRARVYALTGNYLEADPRCCYQPSHEAALVTTAP